MFHILIAVGLVAAFVAGALEGPRVEGWLKTWSAARALKAAQALVAKAEADAKALEAARAAVATAPKPAPVIVPAGAVGATGPMGA